jgi:2-C-methyl-D-erythritol 4-phosphate cytidylyltransferase
MSEFSIIVTAGGIGKRMKANVPKQFMLIHERPILMYTLEQFYEFDPKSQIILTLPEEWMGYWEELIQENEFHIPHRIVTGGKERYDSIKNALKFCTSKYVMVHDGVRPLINLETIATCAKAVKKKGAVIPVVELKESLRELTKEGSVAVDRSMFRIVQTPQCFETEILKNAYDQEFHSKITDDATLVEQTGQTIHFVEGNFENVKITTKSDLIFAEQLLK